MSNKTLVILIIIIAILAVGGYFYWSKVIKTKPVVTPEQAALENAGDAAKAITDSATQGVLPSINPNTNPLQDVPDINPTDKSNPFKDIKTNPFE